MRVMGALAGASARGHDGSAATLNNPYPRGRNRTRRSQPGGWIISHRSLSLGCHPCSNRAAVDGRARRAAAVRHPRCPTSHCGAHLRPRGPDRALTPSGPNQPRVQPHGVQPAEKPGMFDFHAAVHHHFETRGPGALGGGFVDHAQLHPDDFRADGDGVLDNRRHRRRLSRKMSTTSTGPGTSRSDAYEWRPSTSFSRGLTGTTS